MRYNDQAVQPPKEPKKEKEVREMPKPGSYSWNDLDKGVGKRPVWRR